MINFLKKNSVYMHEFSGARKEKKRKKIKENTLNGFLAQGKKMAEGKK